MFKVFLFLILPQLTASAQTPPLYKFMPGVGVNLPCKNLLDHQKQCDDISWTFSNSWENVTLFERGQILSTVKGGWIHRTLSTNCSLQIMSIKLDQSGQYTCRNIKSSGGDTVFEVSVVDVIEPTTTSTTTMTVKPATTKSPAAAGTESPSTASPQTEQVWWLLLLVPVALAAFIITAVTVTRRKKVKRTQTRDDTVQPGDVCYVSVSYTKKTKHKGQAPSKDKGDEDVTYSSVSVLSSSSSSAAAAQASADPNVVYAAISKPKT